MKNQITPTDLFLAILAILLVSVSFYQTWIGLEQIFGTSAFIIALVLALVLLFLLWQIRMAKKAGKSATALSAIYLFFAAFCFIANFNALYTRFMKTDIYNTELRDINKKFNNLETNVDANLNYEVADPKTRQDISRDINQLKIQITDPKNQGRGQYANQIIGRLEKSLGKKITPLTPISKDANGYSDLADRYAQQITQMMENLSPEESQLKTDLSKEVVKWNKQIQAFLLLPNKDKDATAQGLIDESLTAYNKLGLRAHTILGDQKLKFEPAISQTQEIGKIGYAFDHAIANFGMYQFVVLIGCILLDFGIMLIILLMPVDQNSNNNGSVFNNKRRGKTLIPNN